MFSLKRTRFIIIAFWVLSAGFKTMRLFCKCHITSRYGAIVISLCLVISIFSHTKIFLTRRRHQSQVQDHIQQPNQTNQLNIARFRKAVSTALWLQFTLKCHQPPEFFSFKKSTNFPDFISEKIISIDKILTFLQAFEHAISMFTTAQSGIWVGLLVTSLREPS